MPEARKSSLPREPCTLQPWDGFTVRFLMVFDGVFGLRPGGAVFVFLFLHDCLNGKSSPDKVHTNKASIRRIEPATLMHFLECIVPIEHLSIPCKYEFEEQTSTWHEVLDHLLIPDRLPLADPQLQGS